MMRTSIFYRIANVTVCLMFVGSALWAAYCAKCGEKLPERARFCPGCGQPVPKAAPAPVPTPKVTDTFYPDGSVTSSSSVVPARREPVRETIPAPQSQSAQAPNGTAVIGDNGAAKYTAGSLKVGSTPIECVVTFRGHGFEKTKGILVFDQVPPGRYTVSFSRDGKVLDKVVEVQPGKTSFVYGNLARATPKSRAPTVTNPDPEVQHQGMPLGGEPTRAATDGAIAAEPTVLPGKEIQDADDKFLLAETLRKSVNPFTKKERYEKARRLYLEIIERWPASDKIEECHYQLGQIYESMYYGKHRKAIGKYMDVLRLNSHTRFCVRWRIAVLYDNRLGQKTSAREWYEQAAGLSPNQSVRKKAAKAAKLLRKQGF